MPPTPVRTASPPQWTPNGAVIVPANSGFGTLPAVQVAGKQPGRQTITLVNIGAGSCTVLPSPSQSPATGVTLAAGGVWDIDTEGEVWIASVAGTTLDVLTTWWPREDSNRTDLPFYGAAFQ